MWVGYVVRLCRASKSIIFLSFVVTCLYNWLAELTRCHRMRLGRQSKNSWRAPEVFAGVPERCCCFSCANQRMWCRRQDHGIAVKLRKPPSSVTWLYGYGSRESRDGRRRRPVVAEQRWPIGRRQLVTRQRWRGNGRNSKWRRVGRQQYGLWWLRQRRPEWYRN